VITDGAVVINGEILPFKRSTKQVNIVIRETKRALGYEDGDNKDSYFTRWVEFGSGVVQVAWASLKRIENLQSLKTKIESHQHTVPVGLISMWSGANVPDGWALCNGENGTPNLQNKFIMGASDQSPIGTTGGVKEVTLTADQMPGHNHGASVENAGSHSHSMGSTGSHSHPFKNYYFAEDDSHDDGRSGSSYGYEYIEEGVGSGDLDYNNDRVYYKNMNTSSAGSHSHSIDNAGEHSHNVTIDEIGGNKAHENRPPFYALAFIIKL
jgi:microcystin-dependent protein